MKHCASCGTDNTDDALFCRNCGRSLSRSSTCPSCGAATFPDALFCSSCGTQLLQKEMPAAMVQMQSAVGASGWTAEDVSALRYLVLFSIISLLGFVVAAVSVFGPFGGVGLTFSTAPRHSTPALNVTQGFYIEILALFIVMISVILLQMAFRSLARVDTGFATPYRFLYCIYATFALFILLLFLLSLFQPYLSSSSALQTEAIPPGLLLGLLLSSLSLIAVAILGLIGFVLGIWRLGRHYHESLFKASAILYLIPVVNILCPILIMVAASSKSREISLTAKH